MPDTCAAINCTNRSSPHTDVSFFRFPKDPGLKKQWVVNLRRKNFQPSANSRVCSQHFEDNAFDHVFQMKKQFFGVSGSKARRQLKPHACPTIFSFPTSVGLPVPVNVIRRGALEKRRRREIIGCDPFSLKGKRPKASSSNMSSAQGSSPPFGTSQSESLSTTLPPEDEARSQTVGSHGDGTASVVGSHGDGTASVVGSHEDGTASVVGNHGDHGTASVTTECQTYISGQSGILEKYSMATQTRPRVRHFKVQVSVKKSTCAKGFQTDAVVLKETGTQCDLLPISSQVTDAGHCETLDGDDYADEGVVQEDDDDVEWFPAQEMMDDEEEYDSISESSDVLRTDLTPVEERKFIVFESCLLELLNVCMVCFTPCAVLVKRVLGSFLVLSAVCRNGHVKEWSSQPMHRGIPAGNLLLAASSMFSGSSPAQILTLFHHAKIQMISLRTYFLIQTSYLSPAVFAVWEKERRNMLSLRKNKPLKLAGDGRCCSPGHTAKYGTYSLMDLDNSKIIEMQLVQSNEVKNSTAMELEGLKRCLRSLDKAKIKIQALTTDRHVQVKKFMRLCRPGVRHQFDVWHMAKGIKKKLDRCGKTAGLESVALWSRSISNHMYWCAASSGGNGTMVLEKWLSLLNHVCDIHEHQGNHFVHKCKHGLLEDREWLQPGSRALKNIEKIISGKQFLKDIQKLSPGEQTSSLESFHNVICMFAPKHGHNFYEAMTSRLNIAALHFNENSCRPQAKTQLGQPMYGVTYSKSNKGIPVLKEVKTPITYEYVQKLLKTVFDLRSSFPSYRMALEAKQKQTNKPEAVASGYVHEEKSAVICQHRSRFNKT